MSPVNRAGHFSEISPHLQILCKIFDVFIYMRGRAGSVPEISVSGLEILPNEHFIMVTRMNGWMNSGGPDGIVLYCLCRTRNGVPVVRV